MTKKLRFRFSRPIAAIGTLIAFGPGCGNKATKFSTDNGAADLRGSKNPKNVKKSSEQDSNSGSSAYDTEVQNPDGDSEGKVTGEQTVVDADASGIWVEKEFYVGSVQTESVVDQFTLLSPDQIQTIQPSWKVTNKLVELGKQKSSQSRTVEKLQGFTTPSVPQTEYASQSGAGVLDIVLVLDNSGSMSQEQAALKTGLNSLLSHVDNTNWNLHIVSTDTTAGIYRGSNSIISKNDSQRQSKFESTLEEIGTGGDGNEMGIYAASAALFGTHLTAKKGAFETLNSLQKSNWLRDNGNVAVVIMSDEDNCSNAAGCNNENKFPKCELPDASGVLQKYSWNSHECLMGTFRRLGKTPKKDARVYSIVKQVPTIKGNASTCPDAPTVGEAYKAVSVASGGVTGSICATTNGKLDYSAILTAISQDIQQSLKLVYELKSEPAAGSLAVFVNNSLVPNTQYKVVGKTIEFFPNNAPPAGSSLKFQYNTPAIVSGIFNKLALNMKAIPESVQVSLKSSPSDTVGTPLTSGWIFNATTSEVEFSNTPPENQIVSVKFMDAPVKINKFNLPEGAKWNSQALNTEVSISLKSKAGVTRPAVASDFSFDGASVTFLSNPPDYDESVALSWKENEVKSTEASLPGLIVPGSVRCTIVSDDQTISKPVSCIQQGGLVTFSNLLQQGLLPNWKIKIQYQVSLLPNYENGFSLSKNGSRVLGSSLKLKGLPSTTECAGSKVLLDVAQTIAKPVDCSLASDTKLEMSYLYSLSGGTQKEFRFFTNAVTALEWQVSSVFNGNKTTLAESDFELVDKVVLRLKNNPPPMSRVIIRAKVPTGTTL